MRERSRRRGASSGVLQALLWQELPKNFGTNRREEKKKGSGSRISAPRFWQSTSTLSVPSYLCLSVSVWLRRAWLQCRRAQARFFMLRAMNTRQCISSRAMSVSRMSVSRIGPPRTWRRALESDMVKEDRTDVANGALTGSHEAAVLRASHRLSWKRGDLL